MNPSRKNHGSSSPKKKKNTGEISGGAPRKYRKSKSEHQKKNDLEPIPGNQEWGGLARKGVLRVRHDDQKAEEVDRRENKAQDPDEELDPELQQLREERQKRKEAREQRKNELRAEAKAALERANAKNPPRSNKKKKTKQALNRKPLGRRKKTNQDLQSKLRKTLGDSEGRKAIRKFTEVDNAFAKEQFAEAQKKISPLIKKLPTIAEVHELNGLIQYRLGNYVNAADSLEQFRMLANSTDRHPILMDCYRSEERWHDVEFLWKELADVSPSASIVTEGRIVFSAGYADRGDLQKAVRILERGWKLPSRPHEHHLRRAYALADLYDRAGMIPKARELFQWIVKNAGAYVDAKDRLKQLA